MKKILYFLFLTLFVFTSCKQEDEIFDVTLKGKKDKVTICHKGNNITVNGNALEAHLNHGDRRAPCGYTYVPDDDFELQLILKGYDDVLDDYVLTSNINTIKYLDFGELDEPNTTIKDLTGIEDFVELEGLSSYGGIVTTIDLSKNVKLKTLSWNVGPESINLTENINLETLNITGRFTSLDLTNNVKLTSLELGANGIDRWGTDLTSIDLSKNVNLVIFHYYGGFVPILDLTGNLNLKSVWVYSNTVTGLNLTKGNDNWAYLDITPPLCIEVDDLTYFQTLFPREDRFSVNCGF